MKAKLRFNNTYNSGMVTFLIIKEKSKFIGVCLEFDLIVQADNAKETLEQILDYAMLWRRNAIKNKLPEELLNRPAPKKYWEIYKKLVEQDLRKLEAEKQASANVKFEPKTEVIRYQFPYPDLTFA